MPTPPYLRQGQAFYDFLRAALRYPAEYDENIETRICHLYKTLGFPPAAYELGVRHKHQAQYFWTIFFSTMLKNYYLGEEQVMAELELARGAKPGEWLAFNGSRGQWLSARSIQICTLEILLGYNRDDDQYEGCPEYQNWKYLSAIEEAEKQ